MKKIYFVTFFLLACLQVKPQCNNTDFEAGTAAGWNFVHGYSAGVILPCNTCMSVPGAIDTVLTSSASYGSQFSLGIDNYTGIPIVPPNTGTYDLLLGNNVADGRMEQAYKVIQVTSSNDYLVVSFLAVLQRSGHVESTAPYFSVELLDYTGNVLVCSYYNTSDTSSHLISSYGTSTTDTTVDYIGWGTIPYDLTSYLGQTVEIRITVSDCSDGSHFGYAYVDCSCGQWDSYGSNRTACNGDSVQFLAPAGFSNYTWSGPVPIYSHNFYLNASTPGTYSVTYTSVNGCPAAPTTFTLTNLCDTVWPGDANNDLTANNMDILTIGALNTYSGYARASSSINWSPQPASEWYILPTPTLNPVYADCNGDGTADLNDTVAVIQNFSLTHPARFASPGSTTQTGIPLTIVPQQSTVASGGTEIFDLILGDNANPASNTYGLAFTLQFDNSLIDSATAAINSNGGWLGTKGTNLIAIPLKAASETQFAFVRNDHTNVSGNGKIGEISYKALSNITGNATTAFTITNVSLIDASMNNITVDMSAPSATVTVVGGTTGVDSQQGSSLLIYPNPGGEIIYLQGKNVTEIKIFDLVGREKLSTHEKEIDVRGLNNGLYFVSVQTPGGTVTQKIIIQH